MRDSIRAVRARREGFTTLIELLVVVAIMAILMGLANLEGTGLLRPNKDSSGNPVPALKLIDVTDGASNTLLGGDKQMCLSLLGQWQ